MANYEATKYNFNGSDLTGIQGVNTGIIVPWSSGSVPTGFLECNGAAVSRSTYSDLFAVVGTTYGAGDGSSTFNLPDLRGRAVAGQDDMGGSSANRLTGQTDGVDGDTLGGTGGAETHTLTEAQSATISNNLTGSMAFTIADNAGNTLLSSFSGLSQQLANTASGDFGGGGAHNNVQPTLILNYIIKT